MGVTLRGDVAQVFVDGRQVGNLYRWHVDGVDGEWLAEATKYRLVEQVGEAEFRFLLGQPGSRDRIELIALGEFESATLADGVVHRETVLLKGSRIWVRQSESNSQTATGQSSRPTSPLATSGASEPSRTTVDSPMKSSTGWTY